MYSISSAFKAELANDNRAYQIQLVFTFANSVELTVTNSAIWEGGLKFEDAVSGDSDFQIGSAIINKLSITLNNITGAYDDYVFEGATVVAYVGLNLTGGTTEMIRRGTYIIDSVNGQNASLLKLECIDYMSKFDVPYSEVSTVYPATLGRILSDICSYCDVTLLTTTFDESSYSVRIRPSSDGLTCRQMIAYIAQIACKYAKMDEYGRLKLGWFGSSSSPQHDFSSIYNISTSQYTVAITGINIEDEYPETETGEQERFWGTDGYVLSISGNELIQSGYAATVAQMIGQKVIGILSFKTVDATITSDPSVEAGDTAIITDEKGNTAFFPITRVVFSTDGNMEVSCSAQSPTRKAQTVFDQLTRAIIRIKGNTANQISDYDLAVQQLATLMSESFGVFLTEEVQPDGSVIYYRHNKPLLEDSDIQWKMTAGALAVSTDGGETWNAGIDADGNAVVNVLSAVGVNADWLNTGCLRVGDANDPIFFADITNRQVYISGDYVSIGNMSATEALAQLSGALTLTLSNEMQSIPVDSEGQYETFPTTTTDLRAFYGSTDVTASLTDVTYAEYGMTGSLVYSSADQKYVYTATSLTTDTGYVTFTARYNTGTDTVQNAKRFNLFKAYAGPEGSAKIYLLEPSVDIVKRGADEVCTPGAITFWAYYRDGDSPTRYAYTGLFSVDVLRSDSETWETVIVPLTNKTSQVFTIDDEDIENVRCTLYAEAEYDDVWWGLCDDDATELLTDYDGNILQVDHTINIISGGETIDIATVPVVRDISNLTQDKVFDIITNNGTLEGLWYVNGRVYFNASYIATGVLQSHDASIKWDLDNGVMYMSPSKTRVGTASSYESVGDMQARITTTADKLQSEVLDTSNPDSLKSQITQTAGTLSTQVLSTDNENSLVSKITQTAESLSFDVIDTNHTNPNSISTKLSTLRLTNSAIVWNASNSSMTEDGTLWAQNGTFTGDIEAGSTITGAKIYGGTIGTKGDGVAYITVRDGHLAVYRIDDTPTYEDEDGDPTGIVGTRYKILQIDAVKSWYNGDINEFPSGTVPTSRTDGTSSSGITIRNYGYEDVDISWMKSTYYDSALYQASAMHAFRIGSAITAFFTADDVVLNRITTITKNAYINGNLYVQNVRTYGTKSRLVDTEDYGNRLLYCYETPEPLFGDVGEGVIGEDGLCYVQIDPTFHETITTSQYQVFLQAYGDGKCYVKERKSSYFVVAGEPDLEFGWEIKAKQNGFSHLRLDREEAPLETDDTDYAAGATADISENTVDYASSATSYVNSLDVTDYGEEALEHIEEVNHERTAA